MISIQNLERLHAPLREALQTAIDRVCERGAFVLGPEVEAFEQEVGLFLDVAHTVGVSSGTAALELALRAIDVRGHKVLTSAFSFASTGMAILAAGGIPVFIDIDPETFNMDIDQSVETMRREQPKAVIPVHLYGRPLDIAPLVHEARSTGTFVVEDAAQAFGATVQGRSVGTLGHVGCFSFFPTKNLGAFGQGGLVTTDDPEIAERVRRLREPVYKDASTPGATNARLDGLQAAVLRVKLQHVEDWNQTRRRLAEVYQAQLVDLETVTAPRLCAGHVFHQYVVRCSSRDDLKAALENAGIESRVYYPRTLPEYLGVGGEASTFAHAEFAAREVLALPLYPGLTGDEQQYVIAAVQAFDQGRPVQQSFQLMRPCSYRKQTDETAGDYVCDHPRVHLPDNRVDLTICAQCGHAEQNDSNGSLGDRHADIEDRDQSSIVRRFEWAVGMTTAPRRHSTLAESLHTLESAGWESLRLFVEPETELPPEAASLPVTHRDETLGAFPSWLLGLSELYLRAPRADAYLMCQDDVLFAENIRVYLEETLWPAEEVGVVSLYCPAHYGTNGAPGFYVENHGWNTWGALAYVFPNPAVRALLADEQVIAHRHHGRADGMRNIDSVVGSWCRRSGLPYFVHAPSLSQHTGRTSTLYPRSSARGRRRAARFVSDTAQLELDPVGPAESARAEPTFNNLSTAR